MPFEDKKAMPKKKISLQDLKEIAPQLGMETSSQEQIPGKQLEVKDNPDIQNTLQGPPMMYRAQVQGRCNLQFVGDRDGNPNRTQWMEEWRQSTSSPRYCYQYESEGDKTKTPIYSFTVKFPYRVFSNSGQDSIARPVLGKYGIPYIPGSSIKGLLKRLTRSNTLSQNDQDLVQAYCGDEDNPGRLRFHGAYPIGNWANQIVDVVHPQQARQVEDNTAGSAFALLSFYKPEFVFEFSSADDSVDWQKVEELVRQSLQLGLGGKTSTGYGFADKPNYADSEHPDYANARHFDLKGVGVSSVLLDGSPEFRPNLFKATLRGHLKRLFGGVCNDENRIKQEVDAFLGSTDSEGMIRLFYALEDYQPIEAREARDQQTKAHSVSGKLHIAANSSEDLDFIEKILTFAYYLGGSGKSWRRVWHKAFYHKRYRFHIGCHWTSNKIQPVVTKEALQQFLNTLHQSCQQRLSLTNVAPITVWRESFHPSRVAVYCSKAPVTASAAIRLFHDNDFKTTRAIGGRDPHRDHPDKVKAPGYTSHVWHRMLPIGQEQYLEIVTVFHGGHNSDCSPWKRNGKDQLKPFIEKLTECSMTLAWGDPPNA
jgi:CRISPR-associated protein Cmr6